MNQDLNINTAKMNWELEVNDIVRESDMKKRAAMPIHSLVAKFQYLMSQSGSIDLDQDKVRNFQQISEEKIKYYQQSRFGFIKEFFSKLRNLVTLGQFVSSGQLGQNLATKYLQPARQPESSPPPQPQPPAAEDLGTPAPAAERVVEERRSLEPEPSLPPQPSPTTPTMPTEAATGTPLTTGSLPEPHPVGLPSDFPFQEEMKVAFRKAWGQQEEQHLERILRVWNGLFQFTPIEKWETVGDDTYKITLENSAKAKLDFLPPFVFWQLDFRDREITLKIERTEKDKVITFVEGAPLLTTVYLKNYILDSFLISNEMDTSRKSLHDYTFQAIAHDPAGVKKNYESNKYILQFVETDVWNEMMKKID